MLTFDERPMPTLRRGVGSEPILDDGYSLNGGGVYPIPSEEDFRMMNGGTNLFDTVSSYASTGSNRFGDLSQFLLRAGYTVEAARNALQNISAMVNAPTATVDFATQELRYLNNNYRTRDTTSNTWLWLAAGGVLLWLATRRRD